MPVDLSAPTERGHHWSCTDCTFSTTSLQLAMEHCGEKSGDYPAAEHLLHEMPNDKGRHGRGHARRVISCRVESGEALNPRVTRSNWFVKDGRWEIRGITA